jgi:hypothetical protein
MRDIVSTFRNVSTKSDQAHPDVVTLYGASRLHYSGYTLTANGLALGWWTAQIWSHSSVTNNWNTATRRFYIGQSKCLTL